MKDNRDNEISFLKNELKEVTDLANRQTKQIHAMQSIVLEFKDSNELLKIKESAAVDKLAETDAIRHRWKGAFFIVLGTLLLAVVIL